MTSRDCCDDVRFLAQTCSYVLSSPHLSQSGKRSLRKTPGTQNISENMENVILSAVALIFSKDGKASRGGFRNINLKNSFQHRHKAKKTETLQNRAPLGVHQFALVLYKVE